MYEGKPLNSPNDAVVHPNGSIFFTDPPYGTRRRRRLRGQPRRPSTTNAVYRIDPTSGAVERVTDDELDAQRSLLLPRLPEALHRRHRRRPRDIKVFDVVERRPGEWPGLTDIDHVDGAAIAGPDAVRADIDGNIWASAGWVGYGFDGVHVFTPEGERIGHIRLPETTSNLVFGGPKRNRLMITASQSIYAVYVNGRLGEPACPRSASTIRESWVVVATYDAAHRPGPAPSATTSRHLPRREHVQDHAVDRLVRRVASARSPSTSSQAGCGPPKNRSTLRWATSANSGRRSRTSTRPPSPTARSSEQVSAPDPAPASTTRAPGYMSAMPDDLRGVLRVHDGGPARHREHEVGQQRPQREEVLPAAGPSRRCPRGRR